MISKKKFVGATLAMAILLLGAAVTPARTEVVGLTIAPDFGKLPLSFVPNAGQTDPAVRFQAQGMGGTLFFTSGEVVLSLPAPAQARTLQAGVPDPRTFDQDHYRDAPAGPPTVVRLCFEGANPEPEVTGAERLPGIVSYFIGNDPAKWRTNLPTYAGIVYQQLYPGIDLRYDGTEGVLKGTYTVAPGADPTRIRWHYDGTTAVPVDEVTGDLLIELPSPNVVRGAGGEGQGHTLTEQAPAAWQLINGQRVPVTARYTISRDESIGFALGDYDSARPLVIDPTLNYSTFVGGSSDDEGWALALDGYGNAVVTGQISSSSFPTTTGAYDTTHNGERDVFVLKLAADGGSLLYSTFVGGSSDDRGRALALDSAGNAVVTGYTLSYDFPTTAGAYDNSYDGNNSDDVFVLKLAADGGALLYSTFVGGSGNDPGLGLALDGAGNAVVTGFTNSSDFPTTAGAYDTTHNGGEWDGFVFKLAADGGSLLYSTFLGGNRDDYGIALVLDGEGNVVAAAQTLSSNFPTTAGAYDTSPNGDWDVFVLKLAADGGSLLYSTLVGGSGRDDAHAVALDSDGNAVVTGVTWSSNFPTTAGAYDTSYNGGPKDVFVLKLAASGASLLYSTFVGGSSDDHCHYNTLPLDGAGNAVVVGWTGSSDFPTTAGAYDTSHNGNKDVFISKLAADGGSLLYSTFVGGSNDDESWALAMDGAGNAVVTGATKSSDFPTTAGAYDTTHNGGRDVFVLRFDGLGDPDGPAFGPHVTYDVGNTPRYVAVGDLDGDNDVDLVTANIDDNNVSVLLNQGDGTFASQVTYGAGGLPHSVAVGDLDRDGDLDLVTANYGDDNVSVLMNQGEGTFAGQVTYGGGSGSYSVTVGDLDGDGDLDLVTANVHDDTASVLMNQGEGTFAGRVDYSVGNTPRGVAVGDVDGDGDLDLVTANENDSNVSVLMNQGDGTFASQVTYGVGRLYYSVAVGDLDGDGDLDLVTANHWDDNVSVLLNQGDGTFAGQVTYDVGNGSYSVTVGDLDGDGDLDLVTANIEASTVSVLLNQGNGTFAGRVDYSVGNNPRSVPMGDLDGDGDLDLVTANYGDDNVSVLLNRHHLPLNILQLQLMYDPRTGPGAAMGIDGKIYVFGGSDNSLLSSVERYDPTTDTWSYRAPMPGPRGWLRAATAPDGTIYTFGGSTNSFPSTEVWRYDPVSDTWDTSVPQMPTERRDVVAVTGPDGLIYVFGGHWNYNTVEAFDPVNGTWHTKTPMPTGRWCADGALGPDGKIYIAGGGISGQPDGALDSLEVYDTATDSWETKSPMPTGSVGLGAAFGPDGKLYAIGGELYGSGRTGIVYDLIQRYDPLTDSWEIAGNLEIGLSGPSAISDPGGIYVLGGGYLVENGGQYPYTLVPTNWNQYVEIPHAWWGEYYDNRELSGSPVLVRYDAEINFDWGSGSPDPSIPADDFSVRWTRRMLCDAGTYEFRILHDDGARFWVDEDLALDEWGAHVIEDTFARTLTAGEHILKLEYQELTGFAKVRLRWEFLATPILSIPSNIQARASQTVSVPINFTSNGHSIASTAFSVDFDQTCLALDPTDSDQDGIPDAITLNLPGAFNASVTFDEGDTDGELDFFIADLFPPLASLPDSTLATIAFTTTCQPDPGTSIIAPVGFSEDPSASLGNTDGQSVPGTTTDGSVKILPEIAGDCNSDGAVDAGDIAALVLEIFDGDGNSPADTPGGTFPGDPVGCNANGDTVVDAGDISYTVLLIFGGSRARSGKGTLTPTGGLPLPFGLTTLANGPALAIPDQVPASPGGSVTLPVNFTAHDNSISSVVFSVDYDQTWLTFDPTDSNGDDIPDAVTFNLAGAFDASVTFDGGDTDGELDFFIADLFPPLASLSDGAIVSMTLNVGGPPSATEVAVSFSQDPATSFGDTSGESIPGTTDDGSVLIVSTDIYEVYLPLLWKSR